MQTKDAIKFSLNLSNRAVMSVIDEMADSPTAFPTSKGGCHPLWVLGHLTLVEGFIPQLFFGKENPAAKWEKYFADKTEPLADASAYPPFAEVREKYLQLRAQNLELLESLGEQDLDTPTVFQPKGREKEFATFGSSFLTIALHQALHRSHLTDARRMAGRTAVAAAQRA